MSSSYPSNSNGYAGGYSPAGNIDDYQYYSPEVAQVPRMPQAGTRQPYGYDYQVPQAGLQSPYAQQAQQYMRSPGQNRPMERDDRRYPQQQYPSPQYARGIQASPRDQPRPSQPMNRAPSTQSQSTNGSSPLSQSSSTDGEQGRPWVCVHPGCTRGEGFKRKDDLKRHIETHKAKRSLYPCEVRGCNRVGENGLPRYDKLIDHCREVHKMRIPKVKRGEL